MFYGSVAMTTNVLTIVSCCP